jgi:hypothetical protein
MRWRSRGFYDKTLIRRCDGIKRLNIQIRSAGISGQ